MKSVGCKFEKPKFMTQGQTQFPYLPSSQGKMSTEKYLLVSTCRKLPNMLRIDHRTFNSLQFVLLEYRNLADEYLQAMTYIKLTLAPVESLK